MLRGSDTVTRIVRRASRVSVSGIDRAPQRPDLRPLATTLEAPGDEGRAVPVHLHSKVTAIGTLELWCLSRDGKKRWKLEFNVRERPE
jgi:hypothetical protein